MRVGLGEKGWGWIWRKPGGLGDSMTMNKNRS